MRYFALILLFGTFATILINETNARVVSEKHAIATIKSREATVLSSRNWLADLIEALLGMTVVELLSQIQTTLIGVDILLKEAVSVLENVLILVTPEIQAAIDQIISDALASAFETMQPMIDQLDLIMPVITFDIKTKDLITDLIEAILGIPFDEFLANITEAFFGVNVLLIWTIDSLNQIAASVTGEVEEIIENVSEDFVQDANDLLTVVLNKLRQLFPEEVERALLLPMKTRIQMSI